MFHVDHREGEREKASYCQFRVYSGKYSSTIECEIATFLFPTSRQFFTFSWISIFLKSLRAGRFGWIKLKSVHQCLNIQQH